MSVVEKEETWHRSFWNKCEIRTIHKGVIMYTPLFEVVAGKISKGVAYDEAKGVRYSSPYKSIWGVRIVKRFKELFVL